SGSRASTHRRGPATNSASRTGSSPRAERTHTLAGASAAGPCCRNSSRGRGGLWREPHRRVRFGLRKQLAEGAHLHGPAVCRVDLIGPTERFYLTSEDGRRHVRG